MSKVTLNGILTFEVSSMEIVLQDVDSSYENELNGLSVSIIDYNSTSQINSGNLKTSSCDRLNSIIDKEDHWKPLLENEEDYLEEVLDALNYANDTVGPLVTVPKN